MIPLLLLLAPLPASAVTLRTRASPEADHVLNQALSPSFWAGSEPARYEGERYDEIRLKDTAGGYLAYITGEGGRDFDPDVVADIVFEQQDRIPRYTPGARAVVRLGSGHDARVGAPYTDWFFFLDMTVLYATYAERMYRVEDERGRTVLWYEKLEPSFVDEGTWARYQAAIDAASARVERRWLLDAVVPVADVYGMFVVEPGRDHRTRVTYTTKLRFDEEAGWVARFGSQLPPIIRAGLKSGFESCVRLAAAEQDRRGR